MNSLTIRLPASRRQNIKELAKREGISVNQFIASAAAEKMASVLAVAARQRQDAGRTSIAFSQRYRMRNCGVGTSGRRPAASLWCCCRRKLSRGVVSMSALRARLPDDKYRRQRRWPKLGAAVLTA